MPTGRRSLTPRARLMNVYTERAAAAAVTTAMTTDTPSYTASQNRLAVVRRAAFELQASRKGDADQEVFLARAERHALKGEDAFQS